MAKKFFSKALSVGLSLALCAGMVAPAFAASFSELNNAIQGGTGGTDMGGGRYGYGDKLSQEGEDAKYAIEAWDQDDTRHVQLNENVSKEDGSLSSVKIDEGSVDLDLNGNTIKSEDGRVNTVTVSGAKTEATIHDGTIEGGKNGVVVNSANANLESLDISGNENGVKASGKGTVNIEDSTVSGGKNGVLAQGTPTGMGTVNIDGSTVTGYENGVKVESGHVDIKDGAKVNGTKRSGSNDGGMGVLVDGDHASATVSGKDTLVKGYMNGVRVLNGFARIENEAKAKFYGWNGGGFNGAYVCGAQASMEIDGAYTDSVSASEQAKVSIKNSSVGDYSNYAVLGIRAYGEGTVIDVENVIVKSGYEAGATNFSSFSTEKGGKINVYGTENKAVAGSIPVYKDGVNLMDGAAIQLSSGQTVSLTDGQVKITGKDGSEIASCEVPEGAEVVVNQKGVILPDYWKDDGSVYAEQAKLSVDGGELTLGGATVIKTVDEDTGTVTIKTDNGKADKDHRETTTIIDPTDAKGEIQINDDGTTTIPAGSKVQKGDSTHYPVQEVTMNKNGNVNWDVPHIEEYGSYVSMYDGENWTGVGLPEGEKAEVKFVDNGDGTLSAEVDVPAGSWTGDVVDGTYYPNDVTLGLDGRPEDDDTHHITMKYDPDPDDKNENYTGRFEVEAKAEDGKEPVNLTVDSPRMEQDGEQIPAGIPMFNTDEEGRFVDGSIDVPAGSAVTDEDGTTTVYLDGATINPDGLIESNGNTVVLPQGEKPTVDVKSTTEDEDRGTVADEMEIDVPGGTKINKEDDETTCVGDCTLDQDGNVISGTTVTKDKDGDVTIDDGKGGKTEVEVPDGGNADVKVNDDGTVTVTVPEGGKITDKDGNEIDLPDGGEITIDKDGNVTLPKGDDDDGDNGGTGGGTGSNVFENYDFGAGTTNIEDEAVPLAGIVFIQDVLAELYRRAGSPDGADAEGEYDHAVAWALANELIDDETDVEAVVTVAALRAILANYAKEFGANAVAAEDLTTLTGEDDDVVMNCDEVLAEFFGEEYVPAKDEEETAA